MTWADYSKGNNCEKCKHSFVDEHFGLSCRRCEQYLKCEHEEIETNKNQVKNEGE